MKLDPEFYHNLFTSLSNRPHKPIVSSGWSNSAGLTALMKRLQEEAEARHVFIIERTGKQTASYGDLGHIGNTDLTALVVGKALVSDALANLVNNSNFSTASVEGKRWGAHFSALGQRAILIVIYDHQTNVDRVRMRVRRAATEFSEFIAILDKQDNNLGN
ncbi:MAG: roadblock/LC7 domain-containing protein [Acidobacteria bacterium]|nr:roadblock/LC7 domain-containing protein [Acidobacteriota bacterium]